MIITNFKTYQSATAENAVALAKIHQEVAEELDADIRVAVQAMDLFRVAQAVHIPVIAQHIDPIGFGSHTGSVLPEAVKSAGAQGTILNHSEKRLEREVLQRSIERARELGLTTVVCAETPEEGASFLEFDPDYIAVEPPELIGGDISVSTAKPEIIENAARLIGSDKLLVGAGVKNGKDVRLAIKLGAKGVLLASGITKAGDPKAVLMDLASGLVN
jgi:triosephosphate isomerase